MPPPLQQLEAHLKTQIRGQDHAIREVVECVLRGEMGLSTPERPKGSLLFIGPTGVGKTELARALSQFLYGTPEPYRFDMSEFAAADAIKNFIGDESGNLGRLGDLLSKHSSGILLVDEIEKADRKVLDVFLQILSAARVTCGRGKEFNLSQFYVILTSNVGAADVLKAKRLNFTQLEKHILGQLASFFRPEFLGRIKSKLVFKKLSYEVQLEIAQLSLDQEHAFLKKLGHNIEFDPEVLGFLIQMGFDKYLGARPLQDAMEKHVRSPLAHYMVGNAALIADGRLKVHPARTHLIFHPTSR